ncbi:response regulator [Actinokineospora auranticolor]|uniref:response regulator n=1 Tax=Actinokineospora auranticolor TaxID=155976 RepID=UPI0011B022FE|nr:response regulator [Actinokineospora auranticolor]
MAAVVIGGLGLALVRAHARGSDVLAELSVADWFSLKVNLTAAEAARATTAVEAAASERGTEPERREIAPRAQTPARVLWVDDNPDNNVHETIALERLGRFVVKATNSRAALDYLKELDIALVITDLHRGDDSDAGRDLAARLAGRLPVVVYTGDAGTAGVVPGASAVVDQPWDLVDAVQRLLART